MIPRECKRLAEVDFPVAKVSAHSAREKSIRHGHPCTLHLWWARRPLAACRAMLMALLLPDPCDPDCPAEFKRQARRLLAGMPNCGKTTGDAALRTALLSFIADFANWDNSAKPAYLDCARGLVRAAHGEEPPLVVDPFAGGGSIPLEALRLGCDAFASDLNPVACLILKVLLEDIPRHGPALADELRRVGKQIKEAAEKELAEFYPPDPDGAQPIAYLWARTVRCESPKCGGEIPLVRSFWLCKKANRKRALRYGVIRPRGTLPRVEPEIFEPKRDSEVPAGTVSRAKAKCLCCGTVLAPERVRAQLHAQRGGADVIFDEEGRRAGGARLLAVVTLSDERQGRQYRLPRASDYAAVFEAAEALGKATAQPLSNGFSAIPDEPLPPVGTLGFRVQRYGMLKWGDLFTARQKLALLVIAKHVRDLPGAEPVSRVTKRLLVFCINKLADLSNGCCRWEPVAECPRQLFARQAIPIVWDPSEGVPIGESSGSFEVMVDRLAYVLDEIGNDWLAGQVSQRDARNSNLPTEAASVWFTDPPYYDAIPYADLSDFFFVWLRRILKTDASFSRFCDGQALTPKTAEIVQDETKFTADGTVKDRSFFEAGVAAAFSEGRRVLASSGIGSVVFAHKTTEGWEALISGMLFGGWTVTGSWPITTEMGSRLRARESAALSASVHLICRPRPKDAGVGGWEDILRDLPKRIGDWMERLSGEGIRGADLVFSCIGPALELFSRYEHVETAEGRDVKLAEFLEKIWEVVGRSALQQVLGTAEARARNSAAGALEEDARLTALFLWTLQSTARQNGTGEEQGEETEEAEESEEETGGKAKRGFALIYDVARRFAQPLGIHLEDWEGRIIEIEKGVVRLIPVLERSGKLLGPEGAQAMAQAIERSRAIEPQLLLFPEQVTGGTGFQPVEGRPTRRTGKMPVPLPATTLDRVHAAMLLQASGHAAALRALLKTETERSPDFLRLANALSALYPKDSEEKRLLDAMLLASPRR